MAFLSPGHLSSCKPPNPHGHNLQQTAAKEAWDKIKVIMKGKVTTINVQQLAKEKPFKSDFHDTNLGETMGPWVCLKSYGRAPNFQIPKTLMGLVHPPPPKKKKRQEFFLELCVLNFWVPTTNAPFRDGGCFEYFSCDPARWNHLWMLQPPSASEVGLLTRHHPHAWIREKTHQLCQLKCHLQINMVMSHYDGTMFSYVFMV